MGGIKGTAYKDKQPKRDRVPQHDQYGREQKGMEQCPHCKNVHHNKRWYASKEVLPKKVIAKGLPELHAMVCPACSIVQKHLYEGELIIDSVPKQFREELMNLIKNFGEEATKRDPQHRIIKIEKLGSGIRVTSTENQLVDRLAKKIKGAFNKVDVAFSHSKEPYEVDRVRLGFVEKKKK